MIKKYLMVGLAIAISTATVKGQQCTKPLPTKVALGANLNGLSDFDYDRPFNDIFKLNRGFSSDVTLATTVAPTVDALGWPTQDFAVIVATLDPNFTLGTYKIRFNGQATIGNLGSKFTVQNQVYNATTNTTTADLVYTAINSYFRIAFTKTKFSDTEAGIKNVQIMKPGLDFNAPTFSQPFLDHLQRFSTLRYKDWRATDGNITETHWSDRKLPTAPTQANINKVYLGCAWEYCIELANALKKDMWISIPVKADDDYVFQLATLLKSTLDPNLKIYIEYSNELWNTSAGYPQTQVNIDLATIEGNAGGAINFDNINLTNTTGYLGYWQHRRIANRLKQIGDIFKGVYGQSGFGNIYRPVYANQLFYFDVGQRGLEFINNYYGPPKNYFYAIAGAPYFNSSTADASTTATTDDVLQSLSSAKDSIYSGYSTKVSSLFQYQASAKYYGLKLLTYEAGPDTFGSKNVTSKLNAMRSPQMKTICEDFLSKWFTLFGADGLLNWFTGGTGKWDTQYGTWSLTENYENSYKLQAIDASLASTVVAPTAGVVIPGTIDARKYEGKPSTWNSTKTPDFAIPYNSYLQYLINVPVGMTGNYKLSVETQCNVAGKDFIVAVDNQMVTTINVPNNGKTGYVVNAIGEIYLEEGLHTIRFTKTANSATFHLRNYIVELSSLCSTLDNDSFTKPTGFKIAPNPVKNQLHIEFIENQKVVGNEIKIFDITGKLMLNQPIIDQNNTIDTTILPVGIYFVKIGTAYQKFIKE